MLVSQPRILIVAVTAAFLKCNIVVFHAPHAERRNETGELEAIAFWDQLLCHVE